jgi:Fic family protein
VFPNGNGRHARVMADLLLTELAGQRFEWGRGSLVVANELRARYIPALQAADAGDCQPFLYFWRTRDFPTQTRICQSRRPEDHARRPRESFQSGWARTSSLRLGWIGENRKRCPS